MSDYKYFHYDGGRLLARREGGVEMPELLGGTKPGVWRDYPDIERFAHNAQPITEAQFKKEYAEYMKRIKPKNPVKVSQSGLDNPTLKKS